jgi:hypothetical protein
MLPKFLPQESNSGESIEQQFVDHVWSHIGMPVANSVPASQPNNPYNNNALRRSKIETDRLFFHPRYLARHRLATTDSKSDR